METDYSTSRGWQIRSSGLSNHFFLRFGLGPSHWRELLDLGDLGRLADAGCQETSRISCASGLRLQQCKLAVARLAVTITGGVVCRTDRTALCGGKETARARGGATATCRNALLAKPPSIAAAAPGNGVGPATDIATRITRSGN